MGAIGEQVEAQNAARKSSSLDVVALMASIQAKVRSELERGGELGTPLISLAKGERSIPDARGVLRARLENVQHSEELRYLNSHYSFGELIKNRPIVTHRKGLIGRVIVKFKTWLREFMWSSVLHDYVIAERDYQANLVRFLNSLTHYSTTRDGDVFWELVRKIDNDVARALERADRIGEQLAAQQFDAELVLKKGLAASTDAALEEVRALLNEYRDGAVRIPQLESSLAETDRVVRGLESILARLSANVPAAGDGHGVLLPSADNSSAYDRIPIASAGYLLLENRYRGAESEIVKRLEAYKGIFPVSSQYPVLEIGAGRGELQLLLRDWGVKTYGVDLDQGMVDRAAQVGVDVRHVDAFKHLAELPSHSLAGVIAVQVVEHLTYTQLQQLCRECVRTVRPGGFIVFETINPRSLIALSSNYFRDPTHVWPLHPDTLGYAMSLCGLELVETRFLSPFPESEKLAALNVDDYMKPLIAEFVTTLNHNIARLNDLLFGHQDYAIVARVPKNVSNEVSHN